MITQLLQRYGYLMPTVNPDSEAGKEQDLLVQERVKWIAQEEEQQRSQALQQAQDRYEKARKCMQGDSRSCEAATQQGQQGRQGQLPQGLGPEEQQTLPSGPPWFGPISRVRTCNHQPAETIRSNRPSSCKPVNFPTTNFRRHYPETYPAHWTHRRSAEEPGPQPSCSSFSLRMAESRRVLLWAVPD